MARKKKPTLEEMPEEVQNFAGFPAPDYTPVPDILFDKLMAYLTEAELKVLLYIIRRTFGFKKKSDDISLNQLIGGITKKDGEVLDYGTGLHRDSVITALNSLVEKQIIIKKKNSSKERGNEPNTYALHIAGMQVMTPEKTAKQPKVTKEDPGRKIPTSPLYENSDYPLVGKFRLPWYENSDPQETVVQQTVLQETDKTTTTQLSLLASEETDVVVALVDFGYSRNTAKKWTSENGPLYIQEKIEYAKFLLEYAPEKIKTPKGWLRKAIEDDYAAPDGFISKAQRDEDERQFKIEQQRQEELARLEAQRQEKKAQLEEENYARWRDELSRAYGTTEDNFELWERALVGLQSAFRDNMTTYNAFISRAEILSVQDDPENGSGKILLGVETQYAVDKLNHRNKVLFEKEFKFILKKPMQVEFVVVGSPDPALKEVEVEGGGSYSYHDEAILEPSPEPLVAVNGFAH